MDPIVIVAGFIAAVMDVGVGRKADQGIGCNLPAPAVYDRPGFLFDQQDEIIGHTCAVFNVAGAVVVGMLLADLPLGQIVYRLPPKAFFYTFLVAVGSSFLAVLLLQIGVRYLSATTAAVFSLFEPVSCAIAGAVWLSESFTLQKLLGSVIILGAAGLLAAAKPEVSPDSQEALDLLMSAQGFPHPPEEIEKNPGGTP